MKKNRISEPNVLLSADCKLQKNSLQNIPVFLLLGLCLLAVNVFSNLPSSIKEILTPASTDIFGEYIWITGSPRVKEGLYLLSPEQLKKDFPELLHLVTRTSGSAEFDSRVSAIQYKSHLPRLTTLPPAVANIFFQPISINRADKEILGTLPGIGPKLAERIIRRREDKGPFRSKDELLHITGIGPKKFGRLIDYIILN